MTYKYYCSVVVFLWGEEGLRQDCIPWLVRLENDGGKSAGKFSIFFPFPPRSRRFPHLHLLSMISAHPHRNSPILVPAIQVIIIAHW